jgi:lysophospholipid acyltransferase (LPLAT)-like uncharacterized protein
VALAGWVIGVALRLVYRSLRVRLLDPAHLLERRGRGERMVAAFWHDGIALVPLLVTRLGWPRSVTVLLSWHRDAEIAARALRPLGIHAVRGSSTRGGVSGLRGLLAARERGEDLAIVPDGPRGPRHRAKRGVIRIARATGLPLIAIGAAARPVRRLGSWDRLQVPLPFARVTLVASAPLPVPRAGDEVSEGATLAALEAALVQVNAEAAASVGARPA